MTHAFAPRRAPLPFQSVEGGSRPSIGGSGCLDMKPGDRLGHCRRERERRRIVACGGGVRVGGHRHDRIFRLRATGGGLVTAPRHPNQRSASSLPPELRRTSVSASVRHWVHRELGSEVLRWRRLPGASTSAVHRLFLADGTSVVLRRYLWRWVLEDEPESLGVRSTRCGSQYRTSCPSPKFWPPTSTARRSVTASPRS